MPGEVILVVGGILVAAAFALASHMAKGIAQEANPDTPFHRKKSLLNSDETGFYEQLQQVLPEECTILLKVRLEDFLKLSVGANDSEKWKNHALNMNVDYLFCLSSKMMPFLAVDLRDFEGMSKKQRSQYSLKEKILQDAEIDLISYDLNREYEPEELLKDIEEAYDEFREESLAAE